MRWVEKTCIVYYSNLERTSLSNPFCSQYWIIRYIKSNMLSKSSKRDLGLDHYISSKIHYIEVRCIKVWVYLLFFDWKIYVVNKVLFNVHSNIFHLCTYLNFIILFIMTSSTWRCGNNFNISVIVFVLLRGCRVTWLSGHWLGLILKFISVFFFLNLISYFMK